MSLKSKGLHTMEISRLLMSMGQKWNLDSTGITSDTVMLFDITKMVIGDTKVLGGCRLYFFLSVFLNSHLSHTNLGGFQLRLSSRILAATRISVLFKIWIPKWFLKFEMDEHLCLTFYLLATLIGRGDVFYWQNLSP